MTCACIVIFCIYIIIGYSSDLSVCQFSSFSCFKCLNLVNRDPAAAVSCHRFPFLLLWVVNYASASSPCSILVQMVFFSLPMYTYMQMNRNVCFCGGSVVLCIYHFCHRGNKNSALICVVPLTGQRNKNYPLQQDEGLTCPTYIAALRSSAVILKLITQTLNSTIKPGQPLECTAAIMLV